MGRPLGGSRWFPASRRQLAAGSRLSPASQDLLGWLAVARARRWGRHKAGGCRCRNRHQVFAAARSRSLPTLLAAVAAAQLHRVREGPTWAPTDGRPGTEPGAPGPTDDQDASRAAVPNPAGLASPPIPARTLLRGLPPSLVGPQRRRNRSTQGSHCPQARPTSAGPQARPGRNRPPPASQLYSQAHQLTPARAQFQASDA